MSITDKSLFFFFIIAFILLTSPPVQAAWEIGGKAGYDSNVSRTIDNATGDGYAGAYLQYAREASGETRFDWTLAATLEGSAFIKNSGLNNAGITVAPGLTYFPYLSWSINISPFVMGKVFSDNDQTAVAFGAKATFRQPLGRYLYLGEYYMYIDNRAQEDIYSYAEHALGLMLGVNWTRAFFTEIGYEFSIGDSFVTFKTNGTTPIGRGRGKKQGYSSTFSTDVYKDQIDRHSIGLTAGMEVIPSFLVTVSCSYSIMSGDLGSFNNSSAAVGVSYRF